MKKFLIFLCVVALFIFGIFVTKNSNLETKDFINFDSKNIQEKLEKGFEKTLIKANFLADDYQEKTSDLENRVVDNSSELNEKKGNIKEIADIYGSYQSQTDGKFNFWQAKTMLEKKIYNTEELRYDNYCGVKYNPNKETLYDVYEFQSQTKNKTRAKRIEWEHIVPAENFWQHFVEWREWNPSLCGTKKWRKCAEKNKQFALMEWDPYNLIPVVWEINMFRSNLKYGMVTEKNYISFGSSCNFKIDTKNNIAEPTDLSKWLVARASLYFALKYSDYYKISDQQLQLFKAWNKQFPPTKYECVTSYKKEQEVGYPNLIVKAECEKLWFYNNKK